MKNLDKFVKNGVGSKISDRDYYYKYYIENQKKYQETYAKDIWKADSPKIAENFKLDKIHGRNLETEADSLLKERPTYHSKFTEIREDLSKRSGDIDWFLDCIMNFKGNFSNSFEFDLYCQKLRSRNSTQIKEFIDKCFIIKDFNNVPVASAYKDKQEILYDGYLIDIDIGLCNIIRLYTNNFAEWVYLSFGITGQKIEYKNDYLAKKNYIDIKHLERLNEIWIYKDKVITFDETTPAPTSGLRDVTSNYDMGVFSFIISHEYAHHFLGHLSSNELKGLINIFSNHKRQGICSRNHKKEFDADLLGLKICFGETEKPVVKKYMADPYYQTVAGSLLCFTILGQLVRNTKETTASHPSIYDRQKYVLLAICDFLNVLPKKDKIFLTSVVFHVLTYQITIYEIQKHGLGKYYDDFIDLLKKEIPELRE